MMSRACWPNWKAPRPRIAFPIDGQPNEQNMTTQPNPIGDLTVLEPVSDSAVLAGHDRQRVLVEWNATAMDYPRDVCVHQLFEQQVAQTPDSVAVTFENQSLTYKALNERANQLARYLRALGVGPEVLVGICVDRSLEMLVAVLGVLKAGGAYIPLDPSYPKDRLAFILEDAGASLLVTEERLRSVVPASTARAVCLDSEWSSIAELKGANLPSETHPDNLAYVLYTSGSTGKPKGVQIEHRNVVNFLCTMRQHPGMTDRDVLVAVTTLSFDIAGLELFLPLLAGARVIIVRRKVATDGTALMRAMAECRATVMQATPATWRLLLDAGWQGNPELKILCGGEALPRDLAARLLPRCASLWNMYGPTETTIWSSVYRVHSASQALAPIGRPIGNTRMYILDAQQRPVPVGVEGELYIGGDGVARGYLNRPELTETKFVSDPFSPHGRLYRTGDLARYLPDGNIEFLGRMDHQVKIRGFRVELGEIEAVLGDHPAIGQNVVVAREDTPGVQRLVSYFVARNGQSPSHRELRACLQSKLPEYMVPSAFMELPALPLTPNGKVDRRALPAPDSSQMTEDVIPPRNAVETRLAGIWERVLGIRPIGANTNFFDLGVDSLTSARLFMEINRVFHRDLPVSTLFEAPVLEQLANLLRDHSLPSRWSSLVPIQPRGSQPPFFCVHGGTGATLFLHTLAEHLGSDQPTYGLQMEGLDGRPIRRKYVEQMAAHYLREIRSVQPAGPYLLGGYCFGGIVAFEMAHQLHRQGQEVALVALLNAPNAAVAQPEIDEDEIETASFENAAGTGANERPTKVRRSKSDHLRALATLPFRQKLPYARDAVSTALAWRLRRAKALQRKFRSFSCGLYVALGITVPQNRRNAYLLRLTHFAERHYKPSFYPGAITVFRGRGLYSDPTLGWNGLAARIDSCEIPGRHRMRRSMMDEPLVQTLAAELKQHMQRAVERPQKLTTGTGQFL
jgi:amino acid adenylation domain-containing protein